MIVVVSLFLFCSGVLRGVGADYAEVLWLYKVELVVCGAAGKKVGVFYSIYPRFLAIRHSVDMVPGSPKILKQRGDGMLGDIHVYLAYSQAVAAAFSNCFTTTTLVYHNAELILKLSMQAISKERTV